MGSLGEGTEEEKKGTEEEKKEKKNEELVGATVGYGIKSKPTVAMMECVQQLSDHPKVNTLTSTVLFLPGLPSIPVTLFLTHVQYIKYCTYKSSLFHTLSYHIFLPTL